jgi:hypothetical protein
MCFYIVQVLDEKQSFSWTNHNLQETFPQPQWSGLQNGQQTSLPRWVFRAATKLSKGLSSTSMSLGSNYNNSWRQKLRSHLFTQRWVRRLITDSDFLSTFERCYDVAQNSPPLSNAIDELRTHHGLKRILRPFRPS